MLATRREQRVRAMYHRFARCEPLNAGCRAQLSVPVSVSLPPPLPFVSKLIGVMWLSPLLILSRLAVAEALRNRIIWLTGAILLLAFLAAEFFGQLVLTEFREFQAAIAAWILRTSAVVVIATFVVTASLRELQDKGVELVLSLPIPRWVYLTAKLLGFSVVSLIVAAACTAMAMVYAPLDQAFVWGITLACELVIVVAFCLLCLLTFNQVTSALFAAALFYAAARTIDSIVLMAGNPISRTDGTAQGVIDLLVAALAYLLPSLSQFAMTEWLVYHTADGSQLVPVLVQTLVYVALLTAVSLFDMYRKAF